MELDWRMVSAIAALIGVIFASHEFSERRKKRWNSTFASVLWKWQEYSTSERTASYSVFLSVNDIDTLNALFSREPVELNVIHLNPIVVSLASDSRLSVKEVNNFSNTESNPFEIQHLSGTDIIKISGYISYRLRFQIIDYLNNLECTLAAIIENKQLFSLIKHQLAFLFDTEGKFVLQHVLEHKYDDLDIPFPSLNKLIESYAYKSLKQ